MVLEHVDEQGLPSAISPETQVSRGVGNKSVPPKPRTSSAPVGVEVSPELPRHITSESMPRHNWLSVPQLDESGHSLRVATTSCFESEILMRGPQVPSQKSSPHCLPSHAGVQTQNRLIPQLHTSPSGQVPQIPPHPSGPQGSGDSSMHEGVH